MKNPEVLGQKIQDIISTDEAYYWIDQAKLNMWTEGACWPLATAILGWMGEKYGILRGVYYDGLLNHAIVEVHTEEGTKYLNGSGLYGPEDMSPYEEVGEFDVLTAQKGFGWCDNVVAWLLDKFKTELGRPENWGLLPLNFTSTLSGENITEESNFAPDARLIAELNEVPYYHGRAVLPEELESSVEDVERWWSPYLTPFGGLYITADRNLAQSYAKEAVECYTDKTDQTVCSFPVIYKVILLRGVEIALDEDSFGWGAMVSDYEAGVGVPWGRLWGSDLYRYLDAVGAAEEFKADIEKLDPTFAIENEEEVEDVIADFEPSWLEDAVAELTRKYVAPVLLGWQRLRRDYPMLSDPLPPNLRILNDRFELKPLFPEFSPRPFDFRTVSGLRESMESVSARLAECSFSEQLECALIATRLGLEAYAQNDGPSVLPTEFFHLLEDYVIYENVTPILELFPFLQTLMEEESSRARKHALRSLLDVANIIINPGLADTYAVLAGADASIACEERIDRETFIALWAEQCPCF